MRLLLESLCVAGLCSSGVSQEVETVFRPLSFEEALAAAGEEDRELLVSFVLEGSDDCRRMAESTWTNPAVLRWLEVEAVAIEVDCAERADLVERLGIELFPTVVVFASDGTEYDRMRGYTRPRHFVLGFKSLLEARETILAARARVAQNPDDPVANIELARALVTGRGRASAVALYERIWTRTRFDPAFQRLRLTMVPAELSELSRRFEPARKIMLKWRRVALKSLAGGELDDRVRAARELAALNQHLSDPEAMLELYVETRDGGEAPQEVVDALFNGQVLRLLYGQRRYRELLAALRDPLVRVEELFAELEELRARAADDDLDPREAASMGVLRNSLFVTSSLYFEALLVEGRKEEALELKDYVVLREPVARSYAAMMRSARKARDSALAREIGRSGLVALDGKEREELQEAITGLFGEE